MSTKKYLSSNKKRKSKTEEEEKIKSLKDSLEKLWKKAKLPNVFTEIQVNLKVPKVGKTFTIDDNFFNIF